MKGGDDTRMGIILKSNFVDFYDDELAKCDYLDADIVYNRTIQNDGKSEELQSLRVLGIPTIQLSSLTNVISTSGKVVLYTGKRHGGLDKKLIDIDTASLMYGTNYPVTPYIQNTGGYTMRLLQIGYRTFNILLRYPYLDEPNISDEDKFKLFEVISIKEVPPTVRFFKNPIYSIDFISNGDRSIAIDLNKTDNLSLLGINQNIISKQDVVKEIIRVLR